MLYSLVKVYSPWCVISNYTFLRQNAFFFTRTLAITFVLYMIQCRCWNRCRCAVVIGPKWSRRSFSTAISGLVSTKAMYCTLFEFWSSGNNYSTDEIYDVAQFNICQLRLFKYIDYEKTKPIVVVRILVSLSIPRYWILSWTHFGWSGWCRIVYMTFCQMSSADILYRI